MDDLVIDTKYTDQIPFLDGCSRKNGRHTIRMSETWASCFPLRCGGYDDSAAGRRTEAVRTGGADQPATVRQMRCCCPRRC